MSLSAISYNNKDNPKNSTPYLPISLKSHIDNSVEEYFKIYNYFINFIQNKLCSKLNNDYTNNIIEIRVYQTKSDISDLVAKDVCTSLSKLFISFTHIEFHYYILYDNDDDYSTFTGYIFNFYSR